MTVVILSFFVSINLMLFCSTFAIAYDDNPTKYHCSSNNFLPC